MKPALLLITFLTPGGGETRWTERTGLIATSPARAGFFFVQRRSAFGTDEIGPASAGRPVQCSLRVLATCQ